MKDVIRLHSSSFLAVLALMVKMLITFELHGILCSNFVYLCILHCPATGMKKFDEASPSIVLAGRALLVKMLITLEPHGIFGSNFAYVFYYCPATGMKKGDVCGLGMQG